MKSFDLEAAKSGAPIVTRDGREAKFVTHIPEASEGFRVVWMQGGIVGCSYENGKLGENIDSRHDLFMKSQKRTVFVNLYKNPPVPMCVGPSISSRVYEREIDAKHAGTSEYCLAMAIAVEIEE